MRDVSGEVDVDELELDVAEAADAFARALNAAGQTARRVAPGAAQGAITGFQVGGPWGALIGAGAGAALGSRTPAVVVGARPGAPATQSGPPATVNLAALQLLAVLLRPEAIEALQQLALGRAGTPTVAVANTAVPTAAFGNLIQSLAESAVVHHHAHARLARAPRWSRHVESVAGENAIDPTARSAALLALLADCEPRELDAEFDEDYDEAALADLADLARLGEG